MSPGSPAPAPTAEPSPRRTVVDIALQVVGRLVNGVFGVVVLIVLTRSLGTEAFGQWSTLSTVIFLGAAVTDLGFTSIAVMRASSDPADAPGWLGALLIVRMAASAAATVGCVIAAVALHRDHAMLIAGALLSLTVLAGGTGALAASFQLQVRNDLTIVVLTVNSILWTAGALVAGLAHLGLVAFAVIFLIANLASSAVQAWLGLRQMRISFAGWRPRLRTFVRIGLPMSLTTLLIYSYARVDQILVFEYAGERGAGLYGAAYRILDQASVIPLSITTTLYPLLVRAHGRERERVAVITQRMLEAMIAPALGGLVIAVVCGGPLMAALFGQAFGAAGTSLALLMGAFVVISLNYLAGSFILLLGLQGYSSRIALAGLVFNVAFNIVFIPRWGFEAAALATLLTELLVLVLNGRRVVAGLGFRPRLGTSARAAVAAVVSIGVLMPLRLAGVAVEATLPAAVIVYGVLLVVLGGIDLRALRRMLRSPSLT